MSERDRRSEDRRRATAEAIERLRELRGSLAGRRGEPPRAGDLYVLEETAAHPVEWLVLEAAGEDDGGLLVVPADTCPLVGSGDVEVSAAEPGGPLTLRCRFGRRVPAGVLAGGRRAGAVAADALERARERRGALAPGEGASGGEPASRLEREVDAESAYRDWIDEVVAPAGEALALAAAAGGEPAGQGRGEPAPAPPSAAQAPPLPGPKKLLAALPPALAALFLLASVGLAFWVAALRREVASLSSPALVSGAEVMLGERTRGPYTIDLSPGPAFFVIHVLLGADLPEFPTYRVTLAGEGETILWISPPLSRMARFEAEHSLILPRGFLGPEGARLQLYGVEADGSRHLVDEAWIALESAASSPGRD